MAKQNLVEQTSGRVLAQDSAMITRLQINIPMPAGAAVPRAPQSQSASIPQAGQAKPAAAQSR
jgi:hypothetical protein